MSQTLVVHLRLFPWINAEDISSLLRHVDYAYTALYTHNYKEFQSITRKIEPGYPKNNYACNTLAIVPVRMLCAGHVYGLLATCGQQPRQRQDNQQADERHDDHHDDDVRVA